MPFTSVYPQYIYTPIHLYTPCMSPHTSVSPSTSPHMSVCPIHLYTPPFICLPPWTYLCPHTSVHPLYVPIHLYASRTSPCISMSYTSVHTIQLYAPCTSVHPIHLYTPCMSPYTCIPQVHPSYVCIPYTSVHSPIHLYIPIHLYMYRQIIFCSRGCCQYQIFDFIIVQGQIADFMKVGICKGIWICT